MLEGRATGWCLQCVDRDYRTRDQLAVLLVDSKRSRRIDRSYRILSVKHGFTAAFRNSQSGTIQLGVEFGFGLSELLVEEIEGLAAAMLVISSGLVVAHDVRTALMLEERQTTFLFERALLNIQT